MESSVKTVDKKEVEEEFSLKNYFFPLTTAKAITWIIVIGLIVYANMLFNGFVWDDNTYIINYPLIHQVDLPLLFGTNLFNVLGQYRPIPALYFSILYSIFGNFSFFYHFIQLLLHIALSVIIFLFLCRFLNKNISFFVTLLFIIHPINVESVSYIAQATNQLFVLFGFIAFLFSTKKDLASRDLILISIFALLSILTKETGILFIILIFVYRVLFLNEDKYFIKLLFINFVTIFIYLLIRIFIGHVDFSARPIALIAKLTFVQRFFQIPKIIFYYLSTLFFPKDLAIDQQWIVNSINLLSFYLPLLIDIIFFLAIGWLGIFIKRRQKQYFKIYLFFTIWFMLGILMHIQIFPLDSTVADRYFYFPLIGLIGIIGVSIQTTLKSFTIPKNVLLSIGVILILLLSFRTITRNTVWHDNLSLFSNDAKITNSFDLENYLGNEYLSIHDNKNARIHFEKSVNLYPYDDNLFNLGLTYLNDNNSEKANYYFNQAVENYKGITDPVTFSEYLIVSKDPRDAVILINKVLPQNRNNEQLLILLGIAEYNSGDKLKAKKTINRAYYLNPNFQTQNILNRINNNLPLILQ